MKKKSYYILLKSLLILNLSFQIYFVRRMRTDITYLENMAAGNTDLMIEMIEIFSEQVNDIRNEMLNLHEKQDWFRLGKLAHKAKGTVSIVGMNDLAAELKAFELKAKEGLDTSSYYDFIQKFISETREAEKELNEIADNLK